MKFLNVIDEKRRFIRLKADARGETGQFDSHTMSSAYYLNQMRELRDTVFISLSGKEKPDFQYELESKSRKK